MKLETVQLTNSKVTVLELSRHEALLLAQDLTRQVNGPFEHGDEFKLEDNHYFKISVQRTQTHIIEAINYLALILPKLPENLKNSVLKDLASGDEKTIWSRYLKVKISFDL